MFSNPEHKVRTGSRVTDVSLQDPDVQRATGKTDPVEVMAALREMKNNFK